MARCEVAFSIRVLPSSERVMTTALARPSAVSPKTSTRDQIVHQLEAAHEVGLEYFARYGDTAFFAPMGESWSPAEHVRHLTRSMAPLLPALRLPKVALRVMFGRPAGASMTLTALKEQYRAALDGGATAGRFTPPLDERTGAVRRRAIEDAHSETVRGLTSSMQRWTDAELDAYQLPHPLLGRITVREMLLFTVLHNEHHVAVAERRRLEAGITLG